MIASNYDIVVIGAGPAGSMAARFAAENGASVLILERDREPGIPVRCAEGVSHNGISPFIKIDKRWIAATIEMAKLQSPDGNYAVMYNNGTGYVLERRIFDTALCELACSKGAQLLTKADATGLLQDDKGISGVRYRHLGNIKEVKCRIVIAADGVESRAGRWAGIKTAIKLEDIDTCAQYTITGIDVDNRCCDFYFGNEISPGGYIWVFPKSSHSANVGIGIAGHLAEKKSPQEYLDAFLEQHYPRAKATYTVFGCVPTAVTLKEITADNIMLVGDAARQVNPITGGGIVQGMIAGSLAGKVAADSVRKKDYSAEFLRKYHREWNKRLGNIQKTMHAMKSRFFNMNDDRFNRIVAFCKNIPRDEFSLKIMFTEAVKGDPKLMLDVAKAFVVSKLK
ncbi:MAG: NAD(P)/FAD-dependent oxidoreductase [Candidatus Cloacimonetes bacterium]|nr:NAD(P)/FAD-dependent oxidoreductase [Candidatus Cloacimonadota bacterium]